MLLYQSQPQFISGSIITFFLHVQDLFRTPDLHTYALFLQRKNHSTITEMHSQGKADT